ncbi:MAG: 2-C-methyl-D-erythritol 4-phosphate cytidylyltransferase [Bacillota bacterium]|nr:2-C-methyl-D-erythritol 4-phosphate cytidylyltransferase [Bacillota bacterium]HOB92035.1 2-C-methyl-D-erythritol 4-phosphate cytidylyltransferase [Bacillota bacterium]HPZ54400.1 2-C-methyl-D-erythritol 4-phosphate cytidylyltransferase [Bacillota bacterium]HQD19044.1 2-C-methyl-D-erythritol 4-phosphate cytidylyltransferase [Bacillota bacterium]
MHVAAIVPAAGRGRRMGMGQSKAFLPLQGKPVLAHTLHVLGMCESIDEIVVAVGEQDLDLCGRELSSRVNADRLRVVAGGSTRQESVWNCLLAASPDVDLYLVHDAVRPLVTHQIIESVISLASETGAAVAAVPSKDTVRLSRDGKFFCSTPERSTVWIIQTPQVFSAELLVKAHEAAARDGYVGTDDAALVERLGVRVAVASGSYENIKITTREDLALVEAILKLRKEDESRAGARNDAGQPRHNPSLRYAEGSRSDHAVGASE